MVSVKLALQAVRAEGSSPYGLRMELGDFMKELGTYRQEDQEFKVTLGYTASLRTTWTT